MKNFEQEVRIDERKKVMGEMISIALELKSLGVEPWINDASRIEAIIAHMVKKQDNAELDIIVREYENNNDDNVSSGGVVQ